ncbi:Enoyl-CoA hydratase/isomerase [Desulfarculus baarsii DSM 2075]|uniref:Enoyl-CoA hydratase/isomerase n=1 Tax=Desulfarculus baarsii (strain ATCC 33931 / DSM 2075 / LMG 7858 / VKM B-1802 / 2st14) TaxID=644282 RepID=E1QDI9_DESB2|nr:enoyl-CoA hydratase/isomerase family protein [Desulfarculus baarsii]ADK83508.1 Enoyl-CoA hydratase/isomerase [Desulfarculus baarsii DSM 2075]
MAKTHWRKEGKVAVLTMDDGPNKQDLDFARRMLACLQEIMADAEVSSLVLTSADAKNFSQGVNVEWLLERQQAGDAQTIKQFMYSMNELFKSLLLLPIPSIAVIGGHAYGNGSILACGCDFRFMRADRGYFCFPEINVGIPFLPSMIKYVSRVMPNAYFNELLLSGRPVGGVELEKMGVVTKAIADPELLLSQAIAYAATFEKKRGIFAEMKKRMHAEIIQAMETEDVKHIEALFLMVLD